MQGTRIWLSWAWPWSRYRWGHRVCRHQYVGHLSWGEATASFCFWRLFRGETDQTNIGFEWMTLNNSAKIHVFFKQNVICIYIYTRIITGDSNVVFVSVRKRHLAHPGTKAGDSTGGPTTWVGPAPSFAKIGSVIIGETCVCTEKNHIIIFLKKHLNLILWWIFKVVLIMNQ